MDDDSDDNDDSLSDDSDATEPTRSATTGVLSDRPDRPEFDGEHEPPDGTSVEVLRTTREESRAVLDRKLERLDEIDDKAMRTVRTSVVLLGLLISVAGLAGTERLEGFGFAPSLFSAIGASLLFVSVVLGVFSYTVSENREGIGHRYRVEARSEEYEQSEWLAVLLVGYDEWIHRMSGINDRNKTILALVQGSLVCGLLFLGIALGVSLWPNEVVLYTVAFLALFLGGSVLLIRRT